MRDTSTWNDSPAFNSIVGSFFYKNHTFSYRPGLLTNLFNGTFYPELSDLCSWGRIVLEYWERRLKNKYIGTLVLPDSYWYSIQTVFKKAMLESKGPNINFESWVSSTQIHDCIINSNSLEKPGIYRNSVSEMAAQNIDSGLLHRDELPDSVTIYSGSLLRVFFFQAGYLKRFIETRHVPDGILPQFDMVLENFAREELRISDHKVEIPEELLKRFKQFFSECISYLRGGEEALLINIHNTRQISRLPMFLAGTSQNSLIHFINSNQVSGPKGQGGTIVENSQSDFVNKERPYLPAQIPIGFEQSNLPLLRKQSIPLARLNSSNLPAVFIEPKRGELLGSGTTLKKIGSGGMGVVYMVHNQALDVERAVKILNLQLIPEAMRVQAAERIVTEAQISAKLQHPNIVDVYDVGVWQGLPYLEMAYVSGEDLESIFSKSFQLDPILTYAIAIFVSDALSYAHEKQLMLYGRSFNGIVHRDLKPSNIMLSTEGVVKLMDFGIARPAQFGIHTIEAGVTGTLQYSAYEQLSAGPIDGRSDLFAFGAVLYEAVTGTKCFPQKEFGDLMRARASNSFKALSEFKIKIPNELKAVIQQCLQNDPDKRPSSAAVVSEYLRLGFYKMSQQSPEQVLKSYAFSGGTSNYINSFSTPKKSFKTKFMKIFGS